MHCGTAQNMASMSDFYSNSLHRVLVLLSKEMHFQACYSQGHSFFPYSSSESACYKCIGYDRPFYPSPNMLPMVCCPFRILCINAWVLISFCLGLLCFFPTFLTLSHSLRHSNALFLLILALLANNVDYSESNSSSPSLSVLLSLSSDLLFNPFPTIYLCGFYIVDQRPYRLTIPDGLCNSFPFCAWGSHDFCISE